MEQIIHALANSILLQSLPAHLVESYIETGRFKLATYGKDQILHLEGESCDHLEVITEGIIAVERIDESGGLLTVTTFEPGKLLGANLLFSSNPYYPMTVTAKTASKVLRLSKNLAFELCSLYPDFLLQFLQLISNQTVLLGTKIKHHVRRTIREGIISYLQQEYLHQADLKIIMSLTKKALAERMGISRTSLSRELQKMKKDGLIDYDAKNIILQDLNLLGLKTYQMPKKGS
jgi:CRP-like cAMP-binding protein